MNRRKFLQSSTLAAISTLAWQNKLLALNLNKRYTHHLLIDLGAVRFQDVISHVAQSAMPLLLKLISSEKMILHTFDTINSETTKFSHLIKNKCSFDLNTFDRNSFNPNTEFYDSFLIKKAIESILYTHQDMYVRIYQTEIAHYNISAYRALLSQIDELINKNFMQLTQAGIQIHIYSSKGRNLHPDENGGLHHHIQDINCAKTFYIHSNTKWQIS